MTILQSGVTKSLAEVYSVDQSLRFNSDDTAFMHRTATVEGNRKTWTFSTWAKRVDLASEYIFAMVAGYNNEGWFTFEWRADGGIHIVPGYSYNQYKTTELYRDFGAWYHLCLRCDTTQTSWSDRLRLYVNGESQTIVVSSSDTSGEPAQDAVFGINDNTYHTIGKYQHGTKYLNGYLAETYLIDGTSLGPDSFAETDAVTNQWKPIDSDDVKDAVTFGTNGFYQTYSATELATSFEDTATNGTVTAAFTSTGSTTWTVPVGVTSVDVLVVGGGGGGACQGDGGAGGSGGGGGLVYKTGHTVTPGASITVTVGVGGTNASSNYGAGGTGGDSVFDTLTAKGGGAGKTNSGGGGHAGGDGGSGGGGGWTGGAGGSETQTGQSGDSGTYGFGNNGHAGGSPGGPGNQRGGAGGGAGGAGQDGSGNAGGTGGAGKEIAAFSSYGDGGYFAGGGGAGGYTSGGTAGTGGGGAGGGYSGDGGAGDANTGGGGGGTYFGSSGVGGTGVVLIAYTGSHTVTANGNATQERAQHRAVTANGEAHLIGPKQGTSVISFDGSGDYLTAPNSSDWDLNGTGDFTIEFWVNMNDVSTSDQGIFSRDNSGGTGWIVPWQTGSGGFQFQNPGNNVGTGDGGFADNTWYHIAICRSSGTLSIYADGVLKDSAANTTDLEITDTALAIGRFYVDTDNYYLDGYLDGLRISNNARYTAAFDPPTTAFVSDSNTLLLLQSGSGTTFTDTGANTHTITAYGNIHWFAPKIGSGAVVLIEGSSDNYLSMPASNDFNFNSFDGFTWEAWVQPVDLADGGSSSTWGTLFNSNSGGTKYGIGFDSSGYVYLWYWDTAGSAVQAMGPSTSALSVGTWTHVALVKSGTNILTFMDGTLEKTTAIAGTPDSGNVLFWIGRNTSSEEYAGYLDEIRISNVARYTSTFTPSTTAFTTDMNTSLLIHGDQPQGQWVFDSSTGLAVSEDSRMSFDGTGDYLSVSDSSDWDFGTDNFTAEAWFRANSLPGSAGDTIVGQSGSNTDDRGWAISIRDTANSVTNPLKFMYSTNGTSWSTDSTGGTSTIKINKWYHVAVVRSGTTFYLFVNGSVEDTWTDASSIFNCTADLEVGSTSALSEAFDGYIDEVRISDTARYTTTFTPQTTPFESDSNTMLLIHSDWNGGLGADSSGNNNIWTLSNIAVTDQMKDSPSNNFCTLNPSTANHGAGPRMSYQDMSEGNLKTMGNTATDSANVAGTVSFTSGKWYFECYVVGVSASYNYPRIGMIDTPETSKPSRMAGEANTLGVTYITTGNTNIAGTSASYGDSFTTGDVVGMAIDADNGAAYFSKNGTWQNSGVPTSGASKTNAAYTWTAGTIDFTPSWIPYTTAGGGVANFGQDSSFAGNLTAQGNSDSGTAITDFYYEPPADYLALCTDNLPTPEIKLPGSHFSTVLWAGNSSTQSITGVGFQPDFTWIKKRSGAESHQLFDAIRGATKALHSDTTTIEETIANSLTSFDSDGFSLGYVSEVNNSSHTYVGWNWLAPTTFDPSTAGTIVTASGRSNATAGFSIVKYTGTGVNTTVGHGLSSAPTLVIVKDLDTGGTSWITGGKHIHSDFQGYLELNDSGTGANSATVFQDTPPDASVFSIGSHTHTNDSGDEIIAYCFAPIEAYSSIGTYEGNSNVDGPFIYTGFRPAFFMLKYLDGSDWWFMFDSKRPGYNMTDDSLVANDNYEENSSSAGQQDIDILSNGVKITDSGGGNNSSGTYLYIAFAEYPFKFAPAR